MKHISLILHWMNFDTAFGAAITSLFIANIINSVVPDAAIAALILAILAIYNFDHLLDAKKISGVANSGRHRFYQQNFIYLAIYQLILLIALLVVSWFLSASIAKAGIVLALITLIYFLLLFIVLPNRFVFKELMIAMVFTCGIFLGPVTANYSPEISFDILTLWAEIFLLAMGNTLIFSWLDYESDKVEDQSSLAQIIGPKKVQILIFLVLTTLVLLVVFSLVYGALWIDQLIILTMGIVLIWCLIIAKSFKSDERLRIAGEAIFLIPLFGLLI